MKKMVSTALLGAMLIAPVAAQATIMTGTITGQLLTGANVDYTGVFGFAPGTDITHQAFSATFTFDTSKLDDGSGGAATDIGNVNGPGELSVALTINNVTHVFLSDINNFVEVIPASGDFIINMQYNTATVQDSFFIDVTGLTVPFLTGSTLVQSFSSTGPFDIVTGTFITYDNSVPGSPSQSIGNFDLTNGSISLHPQVSVDVPEPAAIAALFSGLGGLSLLRRRRSTS